MEKITVLFVITGLQLASGLYISPSGGLSRNLETKPAIRNAAGTENDWNIYKRKLGLTNEKVELLKQQKDQQATVDLLNRFIEENPSVNKASADRPAKNPFLKFYHSLLKKMNISKSTLKTSFNFELGDRTNKNHKRPRRKIAVRMVSDMPTEKIDDLLKMFNAQHGIDTSDLDTSDLDQQSDDAEEYNDAYNPLLPSAMDPDYMYENLYEDEEDLDVPAKSRLNSDYGSFQDLILQANRNKWQRENEETKLRSQNNEHFV